MDFFEHQMQAKAASRRLLFLFLLVCFVIVLCVDGLAYLILQFFNEESSASAELSQSSLGNFFKWQMSLSGISVSLGCIGIIAIGCLKRWSELRKGGNGLAIHMGARSLGFASADEKEQQLINVVEEMAIAAGITPPGIYVLDLESSINAFVAGYEFEDSALIVTRGLLMNMNREQLQAVVGHEFSHILHGDNRINIQLLVLLAGILWIAELGSKLAFHVPLDLATDRNGFRDSKYSKGPAIFIGFPLIIVGYVGVFFGRLIRTSISRKREYLADASSVQFTRNPHALAGALNVIRENSRQGFLRNARAEELSHMCISPSKKSFFFASHPPLDDRINAIDNTFLKRVEARVRKAQRKQEQQLESQQTKQENMQMYSGGISQLQQTGSHQLHDVIGTLNSDNLDYAMKLHDQIPYEYRQALHSTERAKTMLLYLLLDASPVIKDKQIQWMTQQTSICQDYLQSLLLLSQGLPKRLALPLVELIIPLLKTLKETQQKTLLKQVLLMAKWNGELSIFDTALYSLIKMSFDKSEVRGNSHTIKKLKVVNTDVNLVLSALIHSSGDDSSVKQELHQRMTRILIKAPLDLLPKGAVSSKALFVSLKKLKHLSPILKRSLMDVCGDIVLHDGIVEGREYETLRLVSLLLACPMPLIDLE
jgi:Zn-dependent protease with chaperone function